MNINGIYLPSDILTCIMCKLPISNLGNWLRTCKQIYNSVDRKIYHARQFQFARRLIRFKYGPVYLIEKYNLFNFLDFYLLYRDKSEKLMFDCKNNPTLYQYLISKYPNNILDLEDTICKYDDLENMKKLNLNIPIGKYGYPTNITLFLLPQITPKRTRQDIQLIPGFNFENLLRLGDVKLLEEYYLRFPQQVNDFEYKFYYPVSTLVWLNNKHLIPSQIELISCGYEEVEYLHNLGIKFTFHDRIIDSLVCRWYKIFYYPESVIEKMAKLSCKIDIKTYHYILYYLNSIPLESRPKKIKVKFCSLYFYCFCSLNKIKVKNEGFVPEIISRDQNWEVLKEKGIEILKQGLVGNLEVELCLRGICEPEIINDELIDYLICSPEILFKLSKNTLNNVFRSLTLPSKFKYSTLGDKILSTSELRQQLEYNSLEPLWFEYTKIMHKLGKCSIYILTCRCDEIQKLCTKYSIDYWKINWKTATNLKSLNIPTSDIQKRNQFIKELGELYYKIIRS